MQSLAWYYHRLKRMSADEVLWRGRGALRELVDLGRLPLGIYPKLSPAKSFDVTSRGFSVAPERCELPPEMQARLVEQADRVLEHRLSFFQHKDLHLGNPIDWHRDWNQQLAAPVKPCPLVDYRVATVSGDCKQVWEPNRHHQWVVLGRAFRATGDNKYAHGFWQQMDSWLEANPFGYGMAWKNPLELGVRLINWVWALDLMRSYQPQPEQWQRAYRALHQHVWDLRRKFSQGSSANNHLIGEVAGTYIATAYLPDLPGADEAQRVTHEILEREIDSQLFESGCTKEQALGYQFFSLQFFTICARVGEMVGRPFSTTFRTRLEAGYRFLAEVAQGGAELPWFGDKDDGYVLDLGDYSHDVCAVSDLYAVLFKGATTARHESAFWLAGATLKTAEDKHTDTPLQSRSYVDAGHYFMQCGTGDDRISLQIDCAPLGYGLLTAHGHADALAFTLRLGGLHMLVDPGTYDYYTYPAWRHAMRRTINHNTVCIDGRDQSEMKGLFLWGSQANAECLEWQDDAQRSVLHGRHDGYAQGEQPVHVARRFELDKVTRELHIVDELEATGEHGYSATLQFHPDCEVHVEGNEIHARRAGQVLTVTAPESVSLSTYHGDETAMLGWFSETYHDKRPATAVLARAAISGSCRFAYTIRMS